MGRRFLSLAVKPGEDCKVAMPPCSALEFKHAALAADRGAPPTERCTLECDLATHQFVLCSLPPGAPMQASLGTVVTNDPDAPAWLFLRARGPRTFHVLGRINVDDRSSTTSKGKAAAQRAPLPDVGFPTADESDDEPWPTASSIARSAPAGLSKRGDGGSGGAEAPEVGSSDLSETIEVLLPEGDDVLEYPLSDVPSDESDDFVNWMSARTQQPSKGGSGSKAAPKVKGGMGSASTPKAGGRGSGKITLEEGAGAPSSSDARGGSRTQRRRAANKRVRAMGDRDGAWEAEEEAGASPAPADAEEPAAAKKKNKKGAKRG